MMQVLKNQRYFAGARAKVSVVLITGACDGRHKNEAEKHSVSEKRSALKLGVKFRLSDFVSTRCTGEFLVSRTREAYDVRIRSNSEIFVRGVHHVASYDLPR